MPPLVRQIGCTLRAAAIAVLCTTLLVGRPSAAGTPGEEGPEAAVSHSDEDAPTIRRYQAYLARQWFRQVGERRSGESFGDLVVRAAKLQMGKPYGGNFKTGEPEQLRVNLSRFECVSYVETTLALARCIWLGQPDAACFAREVQDFRYRDGELVDYASRLHYFTDWIGNNAERGRVAVLTGELGGTPSRQHFDYMTRHVEEYDGLEEPGQMAQLLAVEAQLTSESHLVLPSRQVRSAQNSFENGDIVAIVSDKLPGLMIGHTGFIYRTRTTDEPRYLHASSYHERVLMTAKDMAHYANRQPHRVGVVVIRPLPPGTGKLARLD